MLYILLQLARFNSRMNMKNLAFSLNNYIEEIKIIDENKIFQNSLIC